MYSSQGKSAGTTITRNYVSTGTEPVAYLYQAPYGTIATGNLHECGLVKYVVGSQISQPHQFVTAVRLRVPEFAVCDEEMLCAHCLPNQTQPTLVRIAFSITLDEGRV